MKSPESILERYSNAVENADKQALLALYSPKARIFDMTMPWEHRNLETWSDMIQQWFTHIKSTNGGAEASRIETHIADSLVVMTMFMDYYDTNEQGGRDTMTNRLTWVLEPDGDDWKIIHEHTSAPLTEDEMTPVWNP